MIFKIRQVKIEIALRKQNYDLGIEGDFENLIHFEGI